LKNKDTELSNSIESLSRSQLTEAQVKSLIDAAISAIVDGEGGQRIRSRRIIPDDVIQGATCIGIVYCFARHIGAPAVTG